MQQVTVEELAKEIWESWRDGMRVQGREVATERLLWETLSEDDRQLDLFIAVRVLNRLESMDG